MTTRRRKAGADLRAEPQGPLGHLLQEALDAKRLSYPRTARLLNTAIKQETGEAAGVTPSSLRNWISRWVIPHSDTQRALVTVLGVSADALAKAIDEQTAERARLRMRAATPAAPTTHAPIAPSGPPAPPVTYVDGSGIVLHVSSADDESVTLIVRRREFFEMLATGAGAVLLRDTHNAPSAIDARSLSPAERAIVTEMLLRNIDSAWRLFHNTDTNRMLAIGHAQLYMLKQHRSVLDTRVLPSLYSTTYRLVGAVYHRRGRYQEALEAHDRAYLAALEGGDAWNMAESRTWQAYGMKALGREADTQQATDAALRIVSEYTDVASIRLQARLLASSAENAAHMGDRQLAYRRLHGSQSLLDKLPEHGEEFDRSAWLESAGVCALHLGELDSAIDRFREALESLPADWLARRVFATVGLAGALASRGDEQAALETARTAIPALKAMQAKELTRHFVDSLNKALPDAKDDADLEAFVAEADDAFPPDE